MGNSPQTSRTISLADNPDEVMRALTTLTCESTITIFIDKEFSVKVQRKKSDESGAPDNYIVRPSCPPDEIARRMSMAPLTDLRVRALNEVTTIVPEGIGGTFLQGATVVMGAHTIQLPNFAEASSVSPPLEMNALQVSPRFFDERGIVEIGEVGNAKDGTVLTPPSAVACGTVAAVSVYGPRFKRGAMTGPVESQDRYLIVESSKGALHLAVADGHYTLGHIAAQFAMQKLGEFWRQNSDVGATSRLNTLSADLLQMARLQLPGKLYEDTSSGSRVSMGTCVATASILDGTLSSSHVGDCRVYLLRRSIDGYKVEDVTRDHASTKNYKAITRSIIPTQYSDESVCGEEHFKHVPLQDGDIVLLCSDGWRNLKRVGEFSDVEDPVASICKTKNGVAEIIEALSSLCETQQLVGNEIRLGTDDMVFVAVEYRAPTAL